MHKLDNKEKTTKTKRKPSYVVTLRLLTNTYDDRQLDDRLLVAARLTNSLIADAHYVIRTLRRSSEWISAQEMPKRTKEEKLLRSIAFNNAKKLYGFEQPAFEKRLDLHATDAGYTTRIGSDERQKLAKRVFDAAEQHLYGKRGPLSFKGYNNPLISVEGKSQTNMLRLVIDFDKAEAKFIVKRGWSIPVRLDAKILKNDPWLAEAIRARIKYCRLIKRTIKGQTRWYVQAIFEGISPNKDRLLKNRKKAADLGGADLGVSTLALVTTAGVATIINTASLRAAKLDKEADKLNRTIDRQKRSNNPDFYTPDFKDAKGRKKKGKPLTRAKRKKLGLKGWEKSKRQIKNEKAVAELRRLATAERNRNAGEIANQVCSYVKNIKDDGVSPKALQQNYGKSSRASVPGLLMSKIESKIVAAGGTRTIINSKVLKTSQYDHTTDDCKKKPLSLRQHEFRDGSGMIQRDIYSAVLALCENNNEHSPIEIEKFLKSIDTRLMQAGLLLKHQKTIDDTRTFVSEEVENTQPVESFACKKLRKPRSDPQSLMCEAPWPKESTQFIESAGCQVSPCYNRKNLI